MKNILLFLLFYAVPAVLAMVLINFMDGQQVVFVAGGAHIGIVLVYSIIKSHSSRT